MRVAIRKCAAVAVLALLSACGGGGGGGGSATPTAPGSTSTGTPAAPGLNEIIATTSSTFTPGTLTVAKGTTVTFTFQAVQHNVTFASTAGAPANIPTTASSGVQRIFATAGTFGYDCTLHAGMRGSVVVN